MHDKCYIMRDEAIPSSMVKTNVPVAFSDSSTIPEVMLCETADARPTIAGPGHTPARPQPAPKITAPAINFASTSDRVGMFHLAHLNLVVPFLYRQ